MNKVIIGTANFGMAYGRSNIGQLTRDKIQGIVNFAAAQGIVTFETASAYGEAESIIDGFPGRIITKGKSMADYKRSKALIYPRTYWRYLIHGREHFSPLFWQHLVREYEMGFVRGIGISIYTPDDVLSVFDTMRKYLPPPSPITVELPLNIFDMKCLEIIPLLKSYNVEILARSVFLHGESWKMGVARPMGSDDFVPLAHLSFNMLNKNANINGIIVGVDSPLHLKQILEIPEYEVDYEKLGNNRNTHWLTKVAREGIAPVV